MRWVSEVIAPEPGREAREISIHDYFAGWEDVHTASSDDEFSVSLVELGVWCCQSTQTPPEWGDFGAAQEAHEAKPRRAARTEKIGPSAL